MGTPPADLFVRTSTQREDGDAVVAHVCNENLPTEDPDDAGGHKENSEATFRACVREVGVQPMCVTRTLPP